MIYRELTLRASAAKVLLMQDSFKRMWRSGRCLRTAAVLVGGVSALSACVSVNAPSDKIVIELNINIKHELVVQLAQDAEKAMNEHKDIF